MLSCGEFSHESPIHTSLPAESAGDCAEFLILLSDPKQSVLVERFSEVIEKSC